MSDGRQGDQASAATVEMSLTFERPHWIHTGGSQRRQGTGDENGADDERRGGRNRQRIEW